MSQESQAMQFWFDLQGFIIKGDQKAKKVLHFIENNGYKGNSGYLFLVNGDHGPNFRCPSEVKFGPACKESVSDQKPGSFSSPAVNPNDSHHNSLFHFVFSQDS